MARNPATTFNAFSHAAHLATAADTFVSINNDTWCSMGPIDLGDGPVLLQVPATGGGYYALQFVGRLDEQLRPRWPARDRHRGQQLPADSTRLVGQVPDGAVQLRFPTRIAPIIGR